MQSHLWILLTTVPLRARSEPWRSPTANEKPTLPESAMCWVNRPLPVPGSPGTPGTAQGPTRFWASRQWRTEYQISTAWENMKRQR